MSLLLLTNPPSVLAVAGDWTDFVARSNANMLGHGLSIPIFTLTNWDATTTVPEIALGSIIEVGGSFYQADADTALTPEGGIIDGTVHIKLVPAGGGASVVPTLTNDALPAWDGNKAGWYTGSNKYLPYEMTKASAAYTVKSEYIDQNKTVKIGTAGNITAPTITATTITATTSVITDTISEKTTSAGITVNNNLTVSGAILPTISPTDSSWSLTTAKYIIPRGVYFISSGSYWLEFQANSTWSTIARNGTGTPISSLGGLFFSDGINLRISHSSASSTVYYQKY